MSQGPTTATGAEPAPTGQDALGIATAFLDAFTGRDFETAGGYLADEFRFDGPISHYRSAHEFLAGSRAFAESIHPRRETIAAFGDGREALMLYDLSLLSGATMRVADHYTVREGRIRTETILWDTHGFR